MLESISPSKQFLYRFRNSYVVECMQSHLSYILFVNVSILGSSIKEFDKIELYVTDNGIGISQIKLNLTN